MSETTITEEQRLEAEEEVTPVEALRLALEELLPGGHDRTLDDVNLPGGYDACGNFYYFDEGKDEHGFYIIDDSGKREYDPAKQEEYSATTTALGAFLPDDPLVRDLCDEEEFEDWEGAATIWDVLCPRQFSHGHSFFVSRGETPAEVLFLSPTFRDTPEVRATLRVTVGLARENKGRHIDLKEARRLIAKELEPERRAAREKSLADSRRERKRAGERKELEVSR